MCQGFSNFCRFFVLAKLATSSILGLMSLVNCRWEVCLMYLVNYRWQHSQQRKGAALKGTKDLIICLLPFRVRN